MEVRGMLFIYILLVLCFSGDGIISPVQSRYYSSRAHRKPMTEKITHLHFFLHDILSGANPSAVEVASPATAAVGGDESNPTPFGHVYAINDLLTDGPEATSKVVGNAQGMYLSSGRETPSLVMYVDFGFTTGKFNGSSIGVFSRNPITEPNFREEAVVGGRGKLRMARGFAKVRTSYLNITNGDAILEYFVTVFH
ncbi:dirigent protein 4-like [Malania oleifera]|uniref:dirigent protein 4-like n=1 Tax=Malania oleifera TaxID=397392 RepID=UPI0025AE03F1|nr:dirigent protein 4-like [Malania oleifera]